MTPDATIDLLADAAQIVAALAVLITTGFVWRQLGIQARGHEKDERRFLRESIFVVHDTLQAEQFLNARKNFFGAERHKLDYEAYTSDDRGRARYILSVYNLLNRLLEHDALDETVFRGYWKPALYRDWDRLENFVSGERRKTGNGRLFETTEHLVARWKKMDGAK
jgi:hypothetical protein